MTHLKTGATVEWRWGKGTGEGKVTETFTDDVTRTIKGAKIARHASTDEPAYLIRQKDGDKVLKSESELKGAK